MPANKRQKKKQSTEEKMLIKCVRKVSRQFVIGEMSEDQDGRMPLDADVERALDCLIERLYEKGVMQEGLNEILQEKIEIERKRFG